MTPSEVEAIDTWRFANRVSSRGEAIRRLCQMALFYDDRADGMLEYADEVRATAGKGAKPDAIVNLAIPMAGDIQMLDKVRRLFSDGGNAINMTDIEDAREQLRASRLKRTAAIEETEK